MTTPTTLLGMSHIQTEFGGSNPISLSEYYGVNANVAGSGTIRMAHFLGIASLAAFVPVFSLNDFNTGSSAVQVIFYANGVYHATNIGGITDSGTWKTGGGAASDYEIRFIKDYGDNLAGSSSANNTYLGMGSTRQWSLSSTSTIKSLGMTIDIRMAASPFTVLDTESGTMDVDAT